MAFAQVWNKKPAHMKDWEIKVDFGIYGRSRLGADGMAIWYTQDHAKVRLLVARQ